MPNIQIVSPRIGETLARALEHKPAYQTVKAYAENHTFLGHDVNFSNDQEFVPIPDTKIKGWFETNWVNLRGFFLGKIIEDA